MPYTYALWCAPDANLKPLLAHFADFKIKATFQASVLMSDGGAHGVPGFPIFTGLAMVADVAALGISLPAIAVTPIAWPLVILGVGLDMLLSKGKPKAPKPYPVATYAKVTFGNVSPARIGWAEYILCKLCAREEWQIITPLVVAKNAAYAAKNTKAPRPWAKRQAGAVGTVRWLWEKL